MNWDESWNRKLFWKEVGRLTNGKVENCNKIKGIINYEPGTGGGDMREIQNVFCIEIKGNR